MSNGKLTVEGKEYNYAEYLAKVLEYVQLKGFNKEAFGHIAALFWDLDQRLQKIENASTPVASEPPMEAEQKKPAKTKTAE